MSRFYKTAERNYQDDFMFNPDLTLAKEALLHKDKTISDNLATMDLYSNLPLDYYDPVDAENAKAIKAHYDTKVRDIVAEMQNDITNTGAANRAISGLRKEIEHDWEFGNISKIQKNAAAFREFETKLNALQNPADREAYRKQIDNYIANSDGKGAYGGIFKADELYDQKDIWGMFTASDGFKALQPDEKQVKYDNKKGGYMVTTASGDIELSKSKIGQAYKAFIDSQGLQGYANSRQKYFGENWLDAEGNIRMDAGSYLGDLAANGIPSLAYQKKQSSSTKQADQYSLASFNHNLAKELQRSAAASGGSKGGGKEDGINLNLGKKIQDQKLNRIITDQKLTEKGNQFRQNFPALSKGRNGEPLTGKLSEAEKKILRTVGGEATKRLLDIYERTEREGIMMTGKDLEDTWGLSPKQAEAYVKNANSIVEKRGANVDGIFDFSNSGFGGTDGGLIKGKNLNTIVGQTWKNGYTVTSAKIVGGSTIPVLTNLNDQSKNYLSTQVQLTLSSNKGNTTDSDDMSKYADGGGTKANKTPDRVIYVDMYQNASKLAPQTEY